MFIHISNNYNILIFILLDRMKLVLTNVLHQLLTTERILLVLQIIHRNGPIPKEELRLIYKLSIILLHILTLPYCTGFSNWSLAFYKFSIYSSI